MKASYLGASCAAGMSRARRRCLIARTLRFRWSVLSYAGSDAPDGREALYAAIQLSAFAEPRQDRAGRPLQFDCVGSLTDLKNQRVLLQALALMPAALAALVRVGRRGPRASDLQALGVSLGVSGALDFRGQLPPHEVMAVLYASDVFVLPSLSEGQLRAVLEAWSAGRPAILSDIPAHWYLAERSGAAFLTDPEDSEAWQRSIRKLQHDARLRGRLGRDGASFVRRRHKERAALRAYASIIAEARANI